MRVTDIKLKTFSERRSPTIIDQKMVRILLCIQIGDIKNIDSLNSFNYEVLSALDSPEVHRVQIYCK